MKNIRNFILENEFKIIIKNNNVNVINYYEIKDITEKKVILTYDNGSIVVNGNNLSIKKMLEHEILINGNIKSVEI